MDFTSPGDFVRGPDGLWRFSRAQLVASYAAALEEGLNGVLRSYFSEETLLAPVRLQAPLEFRDAPEFQVTSVGCDGGRELSLGFKCDALLGRCASLEGSVNLNPLATRGGEAARAHLQWAAGPGFPALCRRRPLSIAVEVTSLRVSASGTLSLRFPSAESLVESAVGGLLGADASVSASAGAGAGADAPAGAEGEEPGPRGRPEPSRPGPRPEPRPEPLPEPLPGPAPPEAEARVRLDPDPVRTLELRLLPASWPARWLRPRLEAALLSRVCGGLRSLSFRVPLGPRAAPGPP